MSKKRVLLVAAVSAAVLGAVGCTPRVLKDSTVPSTLVSPSAEGVTAVADLEVAPNKVIGQAKSIVTTPFKPGMSIRDGYLEREALLNALKAGDPAGIGADVLVSAHFHYHRVNNELTVTVVGYPARYKNFRAAPEPPAGKSDLFTVESVGGMSIIGYDKSAASIEQDANGNLVITGKDVAVKPAPAPAAAPSYDAPPIPPQYVPVPLPPPPPPIPEAPVTPAPAGE